MRTILGGLALAWAVGGCYPAEPGVTSDVKFLEVRAGRRTACALTDKGPTLCWGDNEFGQLGNGTTEPSLVPAPMALAPRFADIAPGHATCAIDGEGAPLCWGANIGGTDIKDGSALTLPQAVLTQVRLEQIRTGCGLTAARRAECWGHFSGRYGEADELFLDLEWDCALAVGNAVRCVEPWMLPIGELPPLREIEQGERAFCVLGDDGTPYCWGELSPVTAQDTTAGQFFSDSLAPLSGERKYTTMVVGSRHGCGLDAGGVASCWGDNTYGQIGDGTTVHAMLSGVLRPTPVSGGLKFRSIAAGQDFTCGVTLEHQLYCWGANDRGQLGNGSTVSSLVPVPVTLPEGAT